MSNSVNIAGERKHLERASELRSRLQMLLRRSKETSLCSSAPYLMQFSAPTVHTRHGTSHIALRQGTILCTGSLYAQKDRILLDMFMGALHKDCEKTMKDCFARPIRSFFALIQPERYNKWKLKPTWNPNSFR